MSKGRYDLITDIAIIGAGPAGAGTSLFLSKAGIPHTIFDQATFPRDKICGDALSGKVVSVLKKYDPRLIDIIANDREHFLGSWGVTFVAPNGKSLEVPFRTNPAEQPHAPGFICRRRDFDHFLVGQLDPETARREFGARVTDVVVESRGVRIAYHQDGVEKIAFAKLVIGAEGDRSIVARKLARHKIDPAHYCAGVRGYFRNVAGLHPQNFIELHFLKDVLPGYLWIFPMSGNMANVGIGMLSKYVRERNLNLRELLLRTIQSDPRIAPRFRNAEQVDAIRGWGLPLGTKKRRISGERFLLVGDAASLIDPFTGEGVGNALTSGMIAAQIAREALRENDFSAEFLRLYDDAVWAALWAELKLSYRLQKLIRKPWLFNLVVNKANKNRELRETFTNMFDNLDMRAKLRSPLFYLRLLIND